MPMPKIDIRRDLTMLLKVFRRKMTRMTTLDNLGRMERDII
jgi:hypothetical protein